MQKLPKSNKYGINGFNVLEVDSKTLVGQGAFGKVYQATYQNRDVVLKVLKY